MSVSVFLGSPSVVGAVIKWMKSQTPATMRMCLLEKNTRFPGINSNRKWHQALSNNDPSLIQQDEITTTPDPDPSSDPTIPPCSSGTKPLQYRRHHPKPTTIGRCIHPLLLPAPDMNAHLPTFPKQLGRCRAATADIFLSITHSMDGVSR